MGTLALVGIVEAPLIYQQEAEKEYKRVGYSCWGRKRYGTDFWGCTEYEVLI